MVGAEAEALALTAQRIEAETEEPRTAGEPEAPRRGVAWCHRRDL